MNKLSSRIRLFSTVELENRNICLLLKVKCEIWCIGMACEDCCWPEVGYACGAMLECCPLVNRLHVLIATLEMLQSEWLMKFNDIVITSSAKTLETQQSKKHDANNRLCFVVRIVEFTHMHL